jgi:murein DD-endopeptidase MepM/ murein hydrolase activator NlpD
MSTDERRERASRPALQARITILETFGLDPLSTRAREAWLALRGDKTTPPSRFGLSSLGIFHPRLSVKTWLGGRRVDGRVPISCLFNHTQTPPEEGWSVKKTQVRDFRGGTLTYDSHNGTDFAVPVGTVVTAAAPGKVLRISSEFNRGGLKIFIDHGRGLVTTQNHLARALVHVGDVVGRGEAIALSGYSGLDALVSFPWSVPHVHFNVWLNGEPVDPFGADGDESLWRENNDPKPAAETAEPQADQLTEWDPSAIEAAIEACVDPATRKELRREPEVDRRAMNILFFRNYYPTRFTARPPLARHAHVRSPWLTLPFRREDFVGVAFLASATRSDS